MQLGSVKFLRVISSPFSWCGTVTSFRTMKNYLQSSGVILLKESRMVLLDLFQFSLLDPLNPVQRQDTCVIPWWLIVRKILIMLMDGLNSRLWVLLRCVFFFFFFVLSLWQWLAVGPSCLLEVVLHPQVRKGGAYGSQTAIKWYLHQRKKKNQTKENNGTEQYLL